MSPRARRWLPWLALLVVYVVWGSTYLGIRIVVLEMPPLAAAGARFAVAGAVMAAVAAFSDRRWPTRRQWADYSLAGVLLLAGGNALVMWAEKTVPSGTAALVLATFPLWATLLDGLRAGGQAWSARAWAGVAVGLVGVGLVARPEAGSSPGHWLGIVALVLASLSWTLGSLRAQTASPRLPLFSASAVEMLASSAVLFAESALFGEDLGAFAAASPRAWGALAYLVVFGSLVGFTAFAYAINELPASTVGTYAYVNPVVAVALGAAVLGEAVSASLALGASLIVGAVVLTVGAKGEPGPGAEAPALPLGSDPQYSR